jgi:hypothetical protein
LEILINTDSTSDQNILGGVLGRIGSVGIGVVNIGDIMGLYIKKNDEVIFDPPLA